MRIPNPCLIPFAPLGGALNTNMWCLVGPCEHSELPCAAYRTMRACPAVGHACTAASPYLRHCPNLCGRACGAFTAAAPDSSLIPGARLLAWSMPHRLSGPVVSAWAGSLAGAWPHALLDPAWWRSLRARSLGRCKQTGHVHNTSPGTGGQCQGRFTMTYAMSPKMRLALERLKHSCLD